tara:strand:- start:69 stop:1295 length:1227 start_codon:yes stop_codon:yes gene_type:complete
MDPWERLRQDDDDACENYDFFKLVDDIIDTAEHDNAKGDFLESSIEWVIRVLKKAEEWPEESSSLLKEAADSFSDRARYLDKFISQTDNVKGTIPTKERAIELYKKAEKKAESFDDFYGLADSIADTNRVGDKEWAKKLFKKAEGKAESSYDYKSVADGIAEAGDKEWAKKVYVKSEGKAKECSEFRDLANSINKNLGDQKWSDNIFKKAPLTKEEIKEFKAEEKEAEDYSELSSLAESLFELGDKEWTKKVYKKAETKAENSEDYESLADSIIEKLGDKDWAKKVYKKAVKKKAVKKKVAKKKAVKKKTIKKKVTKKAKSPLTKAQIKGFKEKEKEAEDSFDFIDVAEEIAEVGDKEWAKKVYEKAEEKGKSCNDFKFLAESICENLSDKDWAKSLEQKAKELEDDD